MYLIGEKGPNDTHADLIGCVADLDTALSWYRTHTRFPPMAEKNFLERYMTEGFVEEKWVHFYPTGRYCVKYLVFWQHGTFDAERNLAKKARRK